MSFQENHLGTYGEVFKQSGDYNKGQCYPQHVFYMATERDLEDLQQGYLWFHRDKNVLDENNKEVHAFFTGFDVCANPYAAFISMCFQCNRKYVSHKGRFYLLAFKLDHGDLDGKRHFYVRQGSLTSLRVAEEPLRFSQIMFRTMTILRTNEDFYKFNDKNLTRENGCVRNFAEFYEPANLLVNKRRMRDMLTFCTGQVCEATGMIYWYDMPMSFQKTVYERASKHYKFQLIKKHEDDENCTPSDEAIFQRLPRCLQLFKTTYQNELVVDYKVRDQERLKTAEAKNGVLADLLIQVIGTMEQSNMTVSDEIKAKLYREYTDDFKHFFKGDSERLSKARKVQYDASSTGASSSVA